MRNKITVLIIGGGPTGLTTGIELANLRDLGDHGYDDVKIIVLDANPGPSYKTCAGGVSIGDLDRYNLPVYISKIVKDTVEADGRTFGAFKIETPWQSTVMLSKDRSAATLDRKALNMRLAEEARRLGVEIHFGEKVIKIGTNNVLTSSGHEYYFDFLVGADGSNSFVRSYLKLKSTEKIWAIQYIAPIDYPDIDIEFYIDPKRFGASSYVWIFPHRKDASSPEGRTSIGTGLCVANRQFNVPKLKENLEIWIEERFPGILKKSTYESAPILLDFQGLKFGNIFLAGDAGGFPNDLTGGGIVFGMVSGVYVARKIMNPGYEGREIAEILRAKRNSERFVRLMADPVFGRDAIELSVFLLRFKPFRETMSELLV